MIYVFLADGFEEIEALAPVDLLRRAGQTVETVSINPDKKEVIGARKVSVNADITIDEVDWDKAKLLMLPGGMPGTTNLVACEKLMAKIDDFISKNDENKRVAAICAAPARILGARGHLKGKKATCYPGMEGEMTGATALTDPVVTDGIITTARGMGAAALFGIELVRLTCGEDKAHEIAKAVVME